VKSLGMVKMRGQKDRAEIINTATEKKKNESTTRDRVLETRGAYVREPAKRKGKEQTKRVCR